VIYFVPIGYVRHRYPDDEVKKRRFVDAAVEVLPEYEEGLRGLEEFSHIVILAYLHKSRGRPLVVRPKRVEGRRRSASSPQTAPTGPTQLRCPSSASSGGRGGRCT
jgi:tRNA (Thr-GGU) A37 N-methylase